MHVCKRGHLEGSWERGILVTFVKVGNHVLLWPDVLKMRVHVSNGVFETSLRTILVFIPKLFWELEATEAPVDFAVERELHDAAAFDDARNDGMDGRDVLLVTSPQDTVVKNVHRT